MDHTTTTRTGAGTLIIGAGQAGLQLATSLRELGYTAPITVVGGEEHTPYQRPPLSKIFLSGLATAEDLLLRDAGFYIDNDIAIVSSEWIASVSLDDPADGRGEAVTRSGRVFPFEQVAFTVGGTPRRMQTPGTDLPGIHYLRTIDDASALRGELDVAAHVAVVGGGFVGLEIAASATAKGKQVTVLEAQDRLMARVVAPAMSRFYADAHTRRGTSIVLNAAVSGFRGEDGRVSGVELADGRIVAADVVVVGIGLIPHTELAAPLGIATERGIEVDSHGQTRIPGVVAAGDCAISEHPVHGTIRLESVPNAIAQAKAAASALLKREPGTLAVPWFWSDQADLKLQMAGLSMGYDEVVLRGEPDGEEFSALYYRERQLVSVESVNAPRDYMTVRRILEKGGNVPFGAAGDLSVPLKHHLAR
ncbi:FAD-dependent oxidoreductase [Microbacterium sp. Bi121]|uniref:NAD(P)/FAD-dependent oxidoreductase n=1 Tax=Microbacterium sp. Bi121 TaxID=2822348 RepID=UPI001DA324F0|nr:FAD-dependent oxidoreductase [Microbacterium sp. Bi121]CAH0148827.1 Rhodocoxin reductase [Microbacterium sp. Bi121]